MAAIALFTTASGFLYVMKSDCYDKTYVQSTRMDPGGHWPNAST